MAARGGAPHGRWWNHRHLDRHYRTEATRGLLPAIVREQSPADVGVRLRDSALSQRQRCSRRSLWLQPRTVFVDDDPRHSAEKRLGSRPAHCAIWTEHIRRWNLGASQGRWYYNQGRHILADVEL